MKHLKLSLLLFCFIGSTITAQTKIPPKKKVKKNTTLTAKATTTSTPTPAIKYTISGKVTQTNSYCGGAEPDPETLLACETPQKYPGKKFYIRKGDINSINSKIEFSFVTDDNGNFSFQLPPGTYSIILEEQVNKVDMSKYQSNSSLIVDKKCIDQWWKRPYYTLTISDKDISGLQFSFYHRCFVQTEIPCIQYDGPMPP